MNPPSTPPRIEADVIAERVREHVVDFLGTRLQQLFADADDLLFSMTERASSTHDQNLYLDTMRVLRKQQSPIRERFNEALSSLFAPVKPRLVSKPDLDPTETPTLSLQSSEQLEEELAMASMEAKAAGLFRDALFELERRLPALAPATRVRTNFDVLSPRALCTAFQRALADVDIEFPLKLVIYKLFDRLVVTALGGLYESLLALLDANGVRYAPPSRPPGVGVSASAATSPRSLVDAQTSAMLQSLVAPPGAMVPAATGFQAGPADPAYAGYPAGGNPHPAMNWSAPPWSGATDHSLAQDLASIARGQPLPDVAGAPTEALLRRLQLVGGMLNGVLADPYLTAGTRAAIDSLRFPLIKSALSDAQFFTTPTHPVRALLDDVAVMAAGSRTSGPLHQQQVEELIRQLREQIDVQATLVRSSLAQAEPLSEEIADTFLDAQLAQTRRRRQAVIDKIRQRVGLELEQQRRARELPRNTGTMLRSAWAPMMGLALLRHGSDSAAWHAGAALLRRVLEALDTPCDLSEIDRLCADLEQALCAAGLPAERIAAMIEAFREECEIGEDQAVEDAVVAPESTEPVEVRASAEDGGLVVADSNPVQSRPAADVPKHRVPIRPAVAAPALSRTECLHRLLTPGQWFRVHDHAADVARWMRMSERGTGRGQVGFSEFNERKVMSVPLNQFIDDLMHRRSEPIDPSPAMSQALDCLMALEGKSAAA